MGKDKRKLIIYQAKSGAIEFRGDFDAQTIWANLNQIADLFERDKSVISRHIKNIFKSGELNQNSVVVKIATTAADGKIYHVDYYNLDMIISVGYRVDSKQATQFRVWATSVIKKHLIDGYTINQKRISKNYENFLQAAANIRTLVLADSNVKIKDILELINVFAETWFSLEAYDKNIFPKGGINKKTVAFTTNELSQVLAELKKELIAKKQATAIFGQERNQKTIEGIVGNVFQSVFGRDVYPNIEEKAAHLLYFIVKDHPFIDGNKRSGAFAFVWFLQKAGLLRVSLTSGALTALTLLIAESNPKDKDKMIGLILLLLNKK